jgi:hypothetical protein
MKVIRVPIDEKLLGAIDRQAKTSRTSRAAIIRKACEEYIHRLEEEKLERQYIEGYRKKPEDPVWRQLGSELAAEVWPREDWEEWYDTTRNREGKPT